MIGSHSYTFPEYKVTKSAGVMILSSGLAVPTADFAM